MSPIKNLELVEISDILRNHNPASKPAQERGHAAVAMLLREMAAGPEVLFIIRATHEDDPWSGNIGFPGGRLNHGGESPRQAAERETLEELAYDLTCARLLGRLDDLYGAIMPILVSCFVYQVDRTANFRPNHEIDRTFWCPLTKLLETARHRQAVFFYRGEERAHPAVDLLETRHPLLWGITYRLMRDFFALCGRDFGRLDPSLDR